MVARKSKLVAIFPEPSDVTYESTERILKTCEKILDICAKDRLTINDMQSLPDMLCGEIRKAIGKQISNEVFRNVKSSA